MAKYKLSGDILAQGINCIVRIDTDDESGSNPQEVGFVAEFNIRKNIALQRAEVLGEILPASLDPTSIQATITMRGFTPSKNLFGDGIDSVRGGGKFCMKSFNPDDERLAVRRLRQKSPILIFTMKNTSRSSDQQPGLPPQPTVILPAERDMSWGM
jgi:hypothetical protein